MIVEAQLLCKCGNIVQPVYGERCEDCYAAVQKQSSAPMSTPPRIREICPIRTDRHRSGLKRKDQ